MTPEEFIKYILPELITFLLLLWSEYLGVSTKHKSNAIIQLLMCALTPKEDTQDSPAVIELQPNSTAEPSSSQ